ncbi:MAG: NUDIX domain-containing protein [Chlamydiia bacterium]|nr:NUDIX domain-containing protein [Chlamydiia bacterium]
MKRHFTVSVYIIHGEKVLLLFHPKLQKWLPPGGHLEENESPPEGARREVLEETSLEISFVQQENLWVSRWNAHSFERPYMCLIAKMPEHKGEPAHEHLDLIYLATPIGNPTPTSSDPIRYFSLEEVNALKGDVDIFVETQEAIASILKEEVLSEI